MLTRLNRELKARKLRPHLSAAPAIPHPPRRTRAAGYNTTMRILVIGCSGSGKTTLARRLARELGIPHIPLDRLFWQPGWVESPDAEFIPRVEAACREPAWIMDGGYSRTLPLRLAYADAVLWLDVPRATCLARAVWRFLTHIGQVRDDMGPGCREQLDLAFIRWIWTWQRKHPAALSATLSAWLGRELQPGWTARADDARRVWRGRSWPRDGMATLALHPKLPQE
jgi:adenylate kinase family enzyme